MDLNEYFGFPEGTNAQMRYINLYDVVDSNFPCQSDMTDAFRQERNRYALKQINITNKTTNMTNMLYACSNLGFIEGIGNWDVSNVTDMRYLFFMNQFDNLDGIENWNVSNVTLMGSMFESCSKVKELNISNWNTSNVTLMDSLVKGCGSLVTLGSIRCDSLKDGGYVGLFGGNDKLVNFGGLINLKSSLTYSFNGLNKCPNLSYESCINVLNGLYDFVGNGVTPTSSQAKLLVHQNFLDKVGEEISIATNKGWNVYA